jgi:hypothetical protein
MQEYNKTDKKVHGLSQVIAKFNRTFVPEKPDDSHTNLYFDALSRLLYGRWVQDGEQQYCLVLNVGTFEFQLINEKRRSVFEIYINDRTIQEVEEKIAELLSEVGFDTDGFLDPMHYEIPDYDYFTSPLKPWKEKDIRDWETIRSLANTACFYMKGYVMAEGEIRIWPHHFDTGVYVEANSEIGLGFGLAMKDPMVNEAYFYYSGYGLNGSTLEYDNLPELTDGRWEVSENWKGAVLPITELESEAESKVRTFIEEVSITLLKK